MARKPKRDMTMEQQLAAGPVDLPFLMLALMLVGIGLIMVFSASYATAYYDSSASVQNNPLYYIKRQSVYAVIGLVAMYGMSKMNYQHWRLLTIPMLAVSIVLLVLVLTPLGVKINGARRWLHIFLLFGPTFQPSEIAKVAVIIFFSARLSKRTTEKKKKFSNRTFWGRLGNLGTRLGFMELVPYGAVLGVVVLLVVKEPHMSGTILIMVGAAAVLFAAGINIAWFIAGYRLCWRADDLYHFEHDLYDFPGAAVAGPLERPPGQGLSDHPIPAGHRLRRSAGPGAGQQPPEAAVYSRAGKRLCVLCCGGGAGLCGGGHRPHPVRPAGPAGLLAGHPRPG